MAHRGRWASREFRLFCCSSWMLKLKETLWQNPFTWQGFQSERIRVPALAAGDREQLDQGHWLELKWLRLGPLDHLTPAAVSAHDCVMQERAQRQVTPVTPVMHDLLECREPVLVQGVDRVLVKNGGTLEISLWSHEGKRNRKSLTWGGFEPGAFTLSYSSALFCFCILRLDLNCPGWARTFDFPASAPTVLGWQVCAFALGSLPNDPILENFKLYQEKKHFLKEN